MTRQVAVSLLLVCVSACSVLFPFAEPPDEDGDGDSDSDADSDTDADGDADFFGLALALDRGRALVFVATSRDQIEVYSEADVHTRLSGPLNIGTSLQEMPRGIAHQGDFAYVADGAEGVLVFSYDPENGLQAEGGVSGDAIDVVVTGQFGAYLSSDGSIALFDVSDPANPMTPTPIELPACRAAAIDSAHQDLLLIACAQRAQVELCQVGNLRLTCALSSTASGVPRDVAATDGAVWVAVGLNGVDRFASDFAVPDMDAAPRNKGTPQSADQVTALPDLAVTLSEAAPPDHSSDIAVLHWESGIDELTMDSGTLPVAAHAVLLTPSLKILVAGPGGISELDANAQ